MKLKILFILFIISLFSIGLVSAIDIFNPPTSYEQDFDFDFNISVSWASEYTGSTYNGDGGETTSVAQPYNLWGVFDNDYTTGGGTRWRVPFLETGYPTGSECSGTGLQSDDTWIVMSFDNNKSYDISYFSSRLSGVVGIASGCVNFNIYYCNGYTCPIDELNLSTNDWIYSGKYTSPTNQGERWINHTLNIENARKIKWVCTKGWTSTGGGAGKCGRIEFFDWELYAENVSSYISCDLDNCAFIEPFDYCDDILNHGWFGQSMLPEDCEKLVCNSSGLTQQFYYGFETLTSQSGDIALDFSLDFIDMDIPLKIDLGYNDEFGIRLKFIDGLIYDNDRNELLMAYDENITYDYRILFNLASQTYTLYQDDVRMNLTSKSFINFYNPLSYMDFVQFVPDLYTGGQNCNWILDDISLFVDIPLETADVISEAQKVGGLDFGSINNTFDFNVCKPNEHKQWCFVRSIGSGLLEVFEDWILGSTLIFIVALIMFFGIMLYRQSQKN